MLSAGERHELPRRSCIGYLPDPIQFPGAADQKAVHLSPLARSCIRHRS